MATSRASFGLLASLAAGVAFAACAQGNQLGVGGGVTSVGAGGSRHAATSSSSGGTGGMTMPGGIGSPCPDGTCQTGTCTLIGQGKYCTTSCPPTCPQGTYCSIIAGNPICVPDLGQECDKCTVASDCKLPSDACLTAPPGDTFCARDCTLADACGSGFVCMDMTTYEADGGPGDAGGTGGQSGSGGAGTGGAGGGSPLPSSPTKWCVPMGGASCPCDQKRDGIAHACTNTNMFGTCAGMETCNGMSSMWQGCDAKTAAMEICNGKDDNCDGQIDEGDPNSLCSFMGQPPAHSSWACVDGMCKVGMCSAGWTTYPAGSQGCMCQVDSNEPNGSCAAAKAMGTVTDVGGTPITIQGTLSSDTEQDYYTFDTIDVTQPGTNSYHVAIAFTQPSPNNEFLMDVLRGGPCLDTPSGPGTAITAYDWCVNATNGTMGEAPCGTTTVNLPHCTDHSSIYYLHVYRKPGVTGTCTPYEITINGGGGACDLTQTCM
jgi:hypothetical protein